MNTPYNKDYDEALKKHTKNIELRSLSIIQWVLTSFIAILIVNSFIIYIVPTWFEYEISSLSEVSYFCVLCVFQLLLLIEWSNSNYLTFWGRSFETIISNAVNKSQFLDSDGIKNRRYLVMSSISLCIICFAIGLINEKMSNWLSFFVPVFSSVIAASSIEEISNNKGRFIKLAYFLPICAFIISLEVGFMVSCGWENDSNSIAKYTLLYGSWISNGFLGAFFLHIISVVLKKLEI